MTTTDTKTLEQKDITVVEKEFSTEVLTYKEQAEAFVISTDEDYEKAGDLAGTINEKKKSIDAMRKFFVQPLNVQVDNINAMFMPKVKEADAIVSLLKGKMSVYFTKKEEARIKEEKRLEAIRIEADRKRAEQGKEAIATPVRAVAPVAKTVTSTVAQSQIRKSWTHEVLSMSELPEEIKKAIFAEAYKKGLVTTVVQKFVDAGMREISGVRVYEQATVALKKTK